MQDIGFRPFRAQPQSSWTIADVRHALDEHEEGRFYNSAALADAFGRDSQIVSDLSTLVDSIAARSDVGGLPFSVDPSDDGDQRRAKAIAKQVAPLWWDVFTESVISQVGRDATLLGVSVGRITWHEIGNLTVPRLHPLPVQYLEYREHERRWVYLTEDKGELTVTPGDNKWFLHLPHGERSWMRGAVRPLGIPYALRGFTEVDWARYNEKHGSPQLAIKEPWFATDDVQSNGTANTIYSQAANMSREGILRLPTGQQHDENGWDAKWLELVGNTWETFQAQLKRLDGVISVILLGRDSNRESALGGDGERAADRVATERLSALAGPLATTAREQIWKHFGDQNIPNWDERLAPWGRWNVVPPVDRSTRAETLDRAADAAGKWAALGADIEPIFDEFQIQKKPGAELGAPPPPAPDAGPPKGDEVDVDVSDLDEDEEAA